MSESTHPRAEKAFRLLAVALAVAVVVPFAVFAAPQIAGADRSYAVQSGSMSPAIEAGDAIVVESVPPAEIREGDVIAFRDSGGPGDESRTVTHRVVEVTQTDAGRQFRTKGDANEDPDDRPVPSGAVIGRVAFVIPELGHAVALMSSQTGFAVFVALPFGLLVATELWSLGRAAWSSR